MRVEKCLAAAIVAPPNPLMRPSSRRAFRVHALLLTFTLSLALPAADLIWDANTGASGAQDGAGNWSSSNWLLSTNLTGANQAFVNGDSVVFGAGNGAAGTVTLTSSVTTPSITFQAPGSGAYTLNGSTITLSSGVVTTHASATISSILGGSGGWTKAGSGTLTLSGSSANGITGTLSVQAGTLLLNKVPNSDSQLPQAITSSVTINLGNGSAPAVLRLGRSHQISDTGTVLQFTGTGAQNSVFQLNGFQETVGSLRSSGGAGLIENSHASSAAMLTVANTVADTFSGVIQNGGAGVLHLAKTQTGKLTLTGTHTYTGSTTVANGTLELSAGGKLTATGELRLQTGGTLLLTNSDASNESDRLSNAAPLLLQGGTLLLAHAGADAVHGETVGAARLQAGASTLSIQSHATGSGALTLASLQRQTGATLQYTGATAQNRILITATKPGALGGWATVGNDFAKYDASLGLIAFTAADYQTAGEGQWTFDAQARITSTTTLSANRAVNALHLANPGTFDLNGQSLRIEAGGLLVSGSNASTIAGGTLTAGAGSGARGELIVHQNASAVFEISASITDNGSQPVTLTKSGTGVLKLSGASSFTGGLFMNAGTLQIGHANALPAGITVTLEGGTLDARGFDLSLGSLASSTANTAGLITNSITGYKTLTVGSDHRATRFSGQLGSNLHLTKTGSGSLLLDQRNAAYAGVITIAQGTLVTGSAAALGATGAASKTVILPGATLDISGGISRDEVLEIAGHGVGDQGAIVLNSGDSQNLRNATLTGHATLSVNIRYDFDNQLAGGGYSLTKIGAAELALEGALVQNLGDIHIKQGSITWSGAADLGADAKTLFVDAGAAAQFYNKTADAKAIVLSGGTLRRAGSTGGSSGQKIDVMGGLVLQAGASSILHSNSELTFQLNSLNRQAGATLNLDASTGLATTDTLNSNGILGGYATVGGNTWAVSGNSGTDLAITGLASYQVHGFGVSTNNVDITSSQAPAAFTVNTLRFNAANLTLTLTGTNTVSSGGILITSGANQPKITGGILRGSASGDLIVHQNNGSGGLTVESRIDNHEGATALTKSGTGLLTLTANNTYTGGTFFNGGTVAITKLADASESNLGPSSGGTDNAMAFNNGRLQFASGAAQDASTARDVRLLSGGGILEVANSARTLTLSGVISGEALLEGEGTYSGSSKLTKEGTGTLVLAGTNANTHPGLTTINAGMLRLNKTAGVNAIAGDVVLGNNSGGLDILRLDASHQIRDSSLLTLNGSGSNAGIFRLAGQSETIAGLTGLGIVENEANGTQGALTVQVPDQTTRLFSGQMRNGDGAADDGTLAFIKTGSGTQILTGANTYTGATTIEAGVLQIGEGGTAGSLASTSSVQLQGGTLQIDRSDALVLSNPIGGNGRVVQAGAGVLALSNGTSSYDGVTEILAGTLLVTNTSGSATGQSSVLVRGGVLAGTGRLAGDVVVQDTGRLAPGHPSLDLGLGTLTLASDLTLHRQTSPGVPTLSLQLGTADSLVFNDSAGILAHFDLLGSYLQSQQTLYENESGAHDRLAVQGTLHLQAGTLIALDNALGYQPKFGDVYDLIDWSQLQSSGEPGERSWSADVDLQLPALTNGLAYDLSLFSSSGIVVVVPEPGRAGLLLLSSLLLLRRRRVG